MSKSFNCPNCAAPLDYDGGADLTITCPHCKGSVIVPEELRVDSGAPGAFDLLQLAGQSTRLAEMARLIRAGNKIGAIKIYREVFGVGLKEAKDAVEALMAGKSVVASAPSTRVTFTTVSTSPTRNVNVKLWIAIALVLFFFCPAIFFLPFLPFAAMLNAFMGAEPDVPFVRTPTRVAFETATRAPTNTRIPSPTPTPSFMNLALKIGGSGTGPGLFNDARSIALDSVGNLYVGEYTGGRIQVFDSSGKFLTQWIVDAQAPLRSLAADRQGTVYIAQKGVIAKFEGATGKLLGQVQFPDNRFDQVIALPDGGLLALWFESRNGIFTSVQGARDDLVRFDREGKVVTTIPGFLSRLTNNPEFETKLAVDGLGNIFAVGGSFNPAVYKFTPDGKYENKFGSRGNEPGQFRSPQAIAIDNQSRIYVADSNGVLVFAPDGRYLDTFRVEGGSPSGMVFNDKNELFIVARTFVFKYELK